MPFEDFDPIVGKRVNQWLGDDFDESTRKEIEQLASEHKKALSDAFEKRLEFGTGGLRGIMGVGTNRMNIYTVGFATQGLANFLKAKHSGQQLFVAIACDTRHHSEEFARQTAQVFAGNGITAYLLKGFYPIPVLSFACRRYRCQAAVMITASHNTSEYNGYKVYGQDGSQVVFPDDEEIIQEIAKIEHPRDLLIAPSNDPKIIYHHDQVIADYYKEIGRLDPDPVLLSTAKAQDRECKIVYTALHGAGATCTPTALAHWGLDRVFFVKEQMQPDGSFPTVRAPNPEDPAAMALGVKMLLEQDADLLIANDPDSDRMGAVIRDRDTARYLTGNEAGALIFYHLCSTLAEKNALPPSSALIKSWVTSDLLRAIADHFEVQTFEVPTGFKFIAATLRVWQKENKPWHFLFGAEESLGYLTGDHARDKDGVLSACLIAQAVQKAKLAGTTLIDQLNELYMRFGVFREKNFHIDVAPDRAGRAHIEQIMQQLSLHPPSELAGLSIAQVKRLDDASELANSAKEPEMIIWKLADTAKLIVRPSGTEPKIKFYLFNRIPATSKQEVAVSLKLAETQLDQMCQELKALIQTLAPS